VDFKIYNIMLPNLKNTIILYNKTPTPTLVDPSKILKEIKEYKYP